MKDLMENLEVTLGIIGVALYIITMSYHKNNCKHNKKDIEIKKEK